MTAFLAVLSVVASLIALGSAVYILADRGARRRSARYAALARAADAQSLPIRWLVLAGGVLLGAGSLALTL